MAANIFTYIGVAFVAYLFAFPFVEWLERLGRGKGARK